MNSLVEVDGRLEQKYTYDLLSRLTLAKDYNITPSMSRRANCYDNAVAESFFKTFKRELVRKNIFRTR